MCVILTAEEGRMPTISQLAMMSEANPDGAGIAWHDGQHLHRYRNPDNLKTLAYIIERWDEFTEMPFLLHFRLATHGAVKTENTHPFRYTRDGVTGFIAHNGIARRYTQGKWASDSRNAIAAWEHHETDLKDGSQGAFAAIDATGTIRWISGGESLDGRNGLKVSNHHWSEFAWDMACKQSYEDGFAMALDLYGLEPELGEDPLGLSAYQPPHRRR